MASQLAKITADFRTTLATEIAVGGTSGTLQSNLDADGNAIPNGVYFFTLDGDGAQKEYIQATLTGSALTSVRTISRQGVQASGTVRKHRIGAKVQITDFAHIKYMLDLLDGTTDFDAATPLAYDGVATLTPGSNEFATVAYADALTFAGAPNGSTTQKGIFELATVAEQGTAASTGGTGANLVPANANLVKTSSGAGDENKIAVLSASGTFDQSFLNSARTIGAVYSVSADNLQITTDPDSANDATRMSYVDAKARAESITRWFGDSSDGAFAESSGTTTWDTATKTTYQFSSFALTGTADIAIGSNLQNKRVFVLVNGDLTITSSANPAIDGRGRGGAGVAGAISLAAQNGTAGKGIQKVLTTGGLGASAVSNVAVFSGSGGGGGASCVTAGTAGTTASGTAGVGGGTGLLVGASSGSPINLSHWLDILGCGDGGGAGCGSTSGARAGGSGGAGGGCIIFLVKGNINITSTLNFSGATGTAGTNNATNYYTGGGGGGGGGAIAIFYAGSVTANTATLTVSAGGGGANGGGGAGDGGDGGAGIGLVKAIDASLFNVLSNG